MKSGHVCCGLQVRAKIEDIEKDLRDALRLHITTHECDCHERTVVLHHESCGQRVERPLIGCDHVRALWVQRKKCTTVVKNKSIPGNRDTGAETTVVAVYPGDHVPPAIRRGHNDGIAGTIDCSAGPRRLRAARIDGAAKGLRV